MRGGEGEGFKVMGVRGRRCLRMEVAMGGVCFALLKWVAVGIGVSVVLCVSVGCA